MWFKLDDKSWSHPKVVAAGNEAWGAFCRLGAYASDHLTDGEIPSSIAQLIAPVGVLDRLVEVGLLERIADGSFAIHDFLDWNPSGRTVRKTRKVRAEAGRRGAEVTNGKRAANVPASAAANSQQNSGKEAPRTRPVPDPDPVPKKTKIRVAAPTREERPEALVWNHFRRGYEKHRGSKYVADVGRDGKAAKQIAEAAKDLASTDVLRSRLIAFWTDQFFELEDPWLDSHGFPMTALVRALPRLGMPPRDYEPATSAPTPPEDPEVVAAAREKALATMGEAQRSALSFDFDEPNKKPPSSAAVEAGAMNAIANESGVVQNEIGTSESHGHSSAKAASQ